MNDAKKPASYSNTPLPSTPSPSTSDSPPAPTLKDPLEILKFICKDIWPILHGKSIDSLKTNHRGTFVMVDAEFKWIEGFAADASDELCAQLAILVRIS